MYCVPRCFVSCVVFGSDVYLAGGILVTCDVSSTCYTSYALCYLESEPTALYIVVLMAFLVASVCELHRAAIK
jgi:hypothetical protein